jgi:peptide chain release factor subunit 1
VANRLLVDWKPRLANLAETLSRYQHYCVLLTNKETARIFDEFAGELVEHSEIFDSVLKRHAQGGWEQTKLQRRHELQVRHHLKKAGDATLDYFRSHSFDRLVVGINEELWPEMEKVLHPYLKQRLAGRFNVEMNATTNEIQEKVAAIEDELRRQEESSLLKSLGPELKAGKSFVGGLDDVLAALNERRAELLFVESGYSEIGRLCNSCHIVAFKEETCPTCRIDMRLIPNVVDEARELAVRQDARIITVASGHPAMKQAGGVAVRLRY